MAVKVFTRRMVDGQHTDQMRNCVSALEQWASKHIGYFYGEKLEDPSLPGEMLTIDTWQSMEAFHAYASSTPALKLEQHMASALGMRRESTVYVQQPQT